jgi:hypothetical protein
VNLKHIFEGLVIVVAVIFATIFTVQGAYLLAALAFGLGMMWLAADARIESSLETLFFVGFVVLAVIASLDDTLLPLTLLGMCANLAAWDIARFRARLAGQKAQKNHARLEARHVRLLAVVIGAGFLMALLPLFFRLSIPFVVVGAVALITLLMLYQSTRSLHGQRR